MNITGRRLRLLAATIAGLLVTPHVGAGQPANQCEHGQASQLLNANGVSAALYNNGNLFWAGSGPHYNVPVGTSGNSLFLANLWIGGLVDDELRFSGSLYGPWEMWPGPIDDAGNPPEDCSEFDRIYQVSRYELNEFDRTGTPTKGIADWPWQLGAPVEDGDGNPDNYDIDAGDRPAIEGDQSVWWVMNDAAGPHEDFGAPPLGVEVRVMASAVSSAMEELHHTTFYRFTLVNRSDSDVDSMYFGMYVDPDLGDAGDDYVGSDSTLGLGYTYNGDDFDGGLDGYGDQPPAIGFTVVEGPPMSHFVYFNGDACVQCMPQNARHAYQYMQSLWTDGMPITYGGNGRGFSDTPTAFMYPGQPPAYWSEEDVTGEGIRNTPADRRFAWSAGPFDLPIGASQDIVLAIVWTQGEDRFDSVDQLKAAVPVVKEAYADGLESSEYAIPDSAPELLSPGPVDNQPANLTLTWSDVPYADRYLLEVYSDDGTAFSETFRTVSRPSPDATAQITRDVTLDVDTYYTWRVRPLNPSGYGPWSENRAFRTGTNTLAEPGPLLIDGSEHPAFIQVQGIGDDDACGPDAQSTFGCVEVGGNLVYGSFNGQGDWLMYPRGSGPEAVIGAFAPHDFEIRVAEEGSYGYHAFGRGALIPVPFQTWDIGPTGPFGVNDSTDDVRLVPVLFSDGGGECDFGFGEFFDDSYGEGWPATDRVYAYYPISTYDEFAAVAQETVDGDPDGCPATPETDSAANQIDFARGRPLQRLVFMMDSTSVNFRPEMIPVGNVIRFLTTAAEPPQPSAPSPGSIVSSEVTLYWQLAPNADTSRVQISEAADFTTVLRDELVAGKQLYVEGLESGTHYWRVSYGQDEWSEVWDFVVVPGTAAEDDGFGLPTELELKPTYPNPSSGPRTLVFGVPKTQRVSLEVFDLLGRRVESISAGEQTAGWHSETWNPKELSAGVYFVVLQSGAERETQPIVIAK